MTFMENVIVTGNRTKNLITQVRDIEANNLAGEKLRSAIIEGIDPSDLFHDDVRQNGIFYTKFRDFLVSRGVTLPRHSTGRIIRQIGYHLYPDEESTSISIKLIDPSPHEANQNESIPERDAPDDSRKVHNVAMRLDKEEKKFSGRIDENIAEYLSNYECIAIDYNLSEADKYRFLHNLFRGDAKRFFLDKIKPFVRSYNEAVKRMNQEFNSATKQEKILTQLRSLRITKLISSTTSASTALDTIYQTITKLTPQAPPSHRHDAHMLEFLRKAVIGQKWAGDALKRAAPDKLSFHQLYVNLEAALQHHLEEVAANNMDRLTIETETRDDNCGYGIPGIHFTGQARYGRDPKHFRSRHRNHNGQYHDKRRQRDIICWNCGENGHVVGSLSCKKPVNHTRVMAKRVDYYNKKFGKSDKNYRTVLFELCQDLDAQESDVESDSVADEIFFVDDVEKTIQEVRDSHIDAAKNHATPSLNNALYSDDDF